MPKRHRNGVRGKRAHQGVLKTIRPSKEAAELAVLLGRPYDWTALQDAFRSDRKGIPSAQFNRQVQDELKKLKLFGPKREAKRIELRQALIAEVQGERHRLRIMGWDLHDLVSEYSTHHRVRIQRLPPQQQPAAAKEMLAAYLHRYCDSDAELHKLRGLAAKHIEQRKAEALAKKRQQYIGMKMREAGLKNAPRRPMTRMLFPRSAADPIEACESFFRKAALYHQAALAIDPSLARLSSKERAKIVLSNTPLVRPDDEMWHSKRAAFIRNTDTFDPNND